MMGSVMAALLEFGAQDGVAGHQSEASEGQGKECEIVHLSLRS